jgi:hypothetical protein
MSVFTPTRFICLICAVFLSANAQIQPVPESERANVSSVRELLAVMDVRTTFDNMWPQMESFLDQSMKASLQGKTITPAMNSELVRVRTKIMSIMMDEFKWDKIEPMFIEIYRKSFTQSEVDSMIAFYRSPAGRAVTKKMPLVLNETMSLTQRIMVPMMKRLDDELKSR